MGVIGTVHLVGDDAVYTIESEEYMDPFFSERQRGELLLLDLLHLVLEDQINHVGWVRHHDPDHAEEYRAAMGEPSKIEDFRVALQLVFKYISQRRFAIFDDRREYQADFEENGGIHSSHAGYLEVKAMIMKTLDDRAGRFTEHQNKLIAQAEKRAKKRGKR